MNIVLYEVEAKRTFYCHLLERTKKEASGIKILSIKI